VEILERYIQEITEDLKLDEFTIKDASLKSPGRKHFWVSRLINHKRNLYKLEAQLEETLGTLVNEVQSQAVIKLSKDSVITAAQNNDLIKNLKLQIKEEKLIIEFLEKTEKSFSSLTYDIKNIIDIIKLEQM
jgi:hypothetical protein